LACAGAVTVVIAAFAASCANTEFPRDAMSELRAAARHSAATGASISGTVGDESGPFVRVTGTVDFPDRSETMTMHSAGASRIYPPYDVRLVGGWVYLMVDAAVIRPSGLSPDAEWIAFRKEPRLLPIPDRAMSPTYPPMVFDHMEAGSVNDVRALPADASGDRRIGFHIPGEDPTDGNVAYVVSLGSDDRIREISSTTTATVKGKARRIQDSVLTFDWSARVEPTSAPAADTVQILAPGENLSPPTTATTIPTPGVYTRGDAVAGNRALFDLDRTQIEASLQATDPRLTAFTFDSNADEVRATFVHAKPTAVSQSDRDLFAWNTAKTLSQSFWFPELVAHARSQHIDPDWLPGLRIVVDQTVYSCSASVEIAMADKGVPLSNWIRSCSP